MNLKQLIRLFLALGLIPALSLPLGSCSEEAALSTGEALALAPVQGEIIYTGTVYQVTWTSSYQGRINISLVRSDTTALMVITENEPASGNFTWKVPGELEAGLDYSLRFRLTDPGTDRFATGRFEIRRPAESGIFTDPRDGETYRINKLGEDWWMCENFRYDSEGSRLYNGKTENLALFA